MVINISTHLTIDIVCIVCMNAGMRLTFPGSFGLFLPQEET